MANIKTSQNLTGDIFNTFAKIMELLVSTEKGTFAQCVAPIYGGSASMIRQMWGSPNWAKGRDKFGEGIDIEKNYLQSVCIPCQRQQAKDRYLNHPESVKEINKASRHKSRDEAHRYVAEYLQSHPCTDCGESDPVVLTFDHVIGNKRMNVADMVTQGYALGEIEKEIAKCEVTCFNCHMRREKKEEGQDIELCK